MTFAEQLFLLAQRQSFSMFDSNVEAIFLLQKREVKDWKSAALSGKSQTHSLICKTNLNSQTNKKPIGNLYKHQAKNTYSLFL